MKVASFVQEYSRSLAGTLSELTGPDQSWLNREVVSRFIYVVATASLGTLNTTYNVLGVVGNGSLVCVAMVLDSPTQKYWNRRAVQHTLSILPSVVTAIVAPSQSLTAPSNRLSNCVTDIFLDAPKPGRWQKVINVAKWPFNHPKAAASALFSLGSMGLAAAYIYNNGYFANAQNKADENSDDDYEPCFPEDQIEEENKLVEEKKELIEEQKEKIQDVPQDPIDPKTAQKRLMPFTEEDFSGLDTCPRLKKGLGQKILAACEPLIGMPYQAPGIPNPDFAGKVLSLDVAKAISGDVDKKVRKYRGIVHPDQNKSPACHNIGTLARCIEVAQQWSGHWNPPEIKLEEDGILGKTKHYFTEAFLNSLPTFVTGREAAVVVSD